jgi:hypothetical protein
MRRRYAAGGRVEKSKMACNKPKRTPSHSKKSHVVKACEGGKEKVIRFGEQGASTAGKPKAGESERMKKKRKSFKARHAKNINKGKMSAAYWADRVKWPIGITILFSLYGEPTYAKWKSESSNRLSQLPVYERISR